jgi:UTP--glucose-1-phosphate uridylyltransferase
MVRQGQALGLGHAVACAASLIGNDPFAVLLPDVLLDATAGTHDLSQMVAAFKRTGHAQIMVEAVPDERVDQYGIVSLAQPIAQPGQGAPIAAIVEKPALAEAPSNLAVVGRYVFPAAILPLLQQTRAGKGGEIQLTDAIDALLAQGQVDAWQMTGSTFDCGSKLGYLEAILHFGLQHATLGAGLRKLMQAQLANGSR